MSFRRTAGRDAQLGGITRALWTTQARGNAARLRTTCTSSASTLLAPRASPREASMALASGSTTSTLDEKAARPRHGLSHAPRAGRMKYRVAQRSNARRG